MNILIFKGAKMTFGKFLTFFDFKSIFQIVYAKLTFYSTPVFNNL